MSRILVVEDEDALAQGLVDVLRLKGYSVTRSAHGDEALKLARAESFELILLDVELPGLSGFEILKALRADENDVRVIMVSARGQEIDRVLGFELGVDDYVTKPFSLSELLGRVKALLRRSMQGEAVVEGPSILSFGTTQVDLKSFIVKQGDEEKKLPAKAFTLLQFLAQKNDQAISREQLLDAVWGQDEFVSQKTLNNMVVKIRQLIEPEPNQPRYLKTVHGVGYRLSLPDRGLG